MKTGPLSVVAVLVGFACSQAAAENETYKWVDADGHTHFSDAPPADRPAARVKLSSQVSAEPQAAAQARDWRMQLQESNLRRARDEAQQRAAEQDRRIELRECSLARGELDALKRGRVFRYDASGERQYLEDKDIPSAIEASQERVGRYCH